MYNVSVHVLTLALNKLSWENVCRVHHTIFSLVTIHKKIPGSCELGNHMLIINQFLRGLSWHTYTAFLGIWHCFFLRIWLSIYKLLTILTILPSWFQNTKLPSGCGVHWYRQFDLNFTLFYTGRGCWGNHCILWRVRKSVIAEEDTHYGFIVSFKAVPFK